MEKKIEQLEIEKLLESARAAAQASEIKTLKIEKQRLLARIKQGKGIINGHKDTIKHLEARLANLGHATRVLYARLIRKPVPVTPSSTRSADEARQHFVNRYHENQSLLNSMGQRSYYRWIWP